MFYLNWKFRAGFLLRSTPPIINHLYLKSFKREHQTVIRLIGVYIGDDMALMMRSIGSRRFAGWDVDPSLSDIVG
jgi:hypothetical protein